MKESLKPIFRVCGINRKMETAISIKGKTHEASIASFLIIGDCRSSALKFPKSNSLLEAVYTNNRISSAAINSTVHLLKFELLIMHL
jgi:hypothetical protein